jgi:uncharacterized protein YegL
MAAELNLGLAGGDLKCACVLLLDTSGSMDGNRIAALNEGLKTLVHELRTDKDGLALRRADIAIVTFDSEVKVIQDFETADRFEAPRLTAQGLTFLGSGIMTALDMIKERKKVYKQNGILYYRPWLFILTDGEPQGEPPEVVDQAAALLRRYQEEKRVAVFPIGVGEANMTTLARIASPTRPKLLAETKFNELFVWLSASLEKRSESMNAGEQMTFDDPKWTA